MTKKARRTITRAKKVRVLRGGRGFQLTRMIKRARDEDESPRGKKPRNKEIRKEKKPKKNNDKHQHLVQLPFTDKGNTNVKGSNERRKGREVKEALCQTHNVRTNSTMQAPSRAC